MSSIKQDFCLREIKVSEKGINSLSWSPDGTRLLVCGNYDYINQSYISVWTTGGHCLWRKKVFVRYVAWSPDGKLLASLEGREGFLCLRHPEQGKLVRQFTEDRNLPPICWSPDSRYIALSEGEPLKNSVKIVDTKDDKTVNYIESSAFSINYSNNGSKIAITDYKGVLIWDTKKTITRLLEFQSNDLLFSSSWEALAWSPQNEFLIFSDRKGIIRHWDVKQKKYLQSLNDKQNRINSLAYHPHGTCFASGSDNAQISLWSPEQDNSLTCFEHPGKVTSINFSSDGTQLASASSDGTIRLWDVTQWMKRSEHKSISKLIHNYLCRQAATLGRKPQLQSTAEPWVPILDSAEGECLGVFCGGRGENSSSVAIDSMHQCLLGGSGDGQLQCWDLHSGNLRWQAGHKNQKGIRDIALSTVQQRIATVSNDGQLQLWDWETGHNLLNIDAHNRPVISVCWLDRDLQLATTSLDNSIRLWNGHRGTLLKKLLGHNDEVYGIAVSPNGRWLASSSWDNTVRIWDLQIYDTVLILELESGVKGVTWSPDGRQLLVGETQSQSLSLWSMLDGKLFKRWKAHKHGYSIAFSTWSPDGRLLASAPYNQGTIENKEGIKLWDASSGKQLACFPFPEKHTWRLAWSADGAFLASSHSDGKESIFRLWDTRQWMSSQSQSQPQQRLTLPADLALLPGQLAIMRRLNITPPTIPIS